MAMSRARKTVLIILGVVLTLVVVVGLGIALLVMTFREGEPDVRDRSVLVLKVAGTLPDHANDDPFAAKVFGAETNSLASLTTQLKKAKADKRIEAVLLQIDFVGVGWAKAAEIRDAVADFRASGKPVYAYMEYGADKELYIAAAADRVYVAPIGDLFINGLAAEAMFFKGSLDKLGIEMDVYQIGKYKNAPDAYTRKEMSEAQREVINALLDDFFNRYRETLARDRKKSVEDINALIDNAPVSAQDAAAAGLIDGALYREQVEAELKKRLGYKDDEKLRTVAASLYKRVSPESLGLNEGERVAVIYASGAIGSGKSDDGSFGGDQMVGSDTVVKALNDARDDKGVKAIIIRVDSPGGSIYPSDLIWNAVESAKQKKPVVISMGDVAASGGYYISMNASRIVAQPSTITGSIGVFGGKPVIKGFYEWLGISNEYVLRGRQAGMFRETEKFTDDERKRFTTMIDGFYWNDFLPKVAEGRKFPNVEAVHAIAQGRVWTGAQAKERGLVDEFGGLDRAVEVAKELAGIPADKGVRRVVFPAPRTFFEQIFGGSNDDDNGGRAEIEARRREQALLNSLPRDVQRALRYVRLFDRMQRGEAMAMMPFELEIK